MKSKLNNSVTRCLLAILIAVTYCLVSPRLTSAYDPPKGKIYMLCVWTGTSRNATPDDKNKAGEDHTKNYNFKMMVEDSKNYFESNLSKIGLDKESLQKNGCFGDYQVLSGENTSPQKIIDKIGELSQKAGKDDALFVYIMSHGASLTPTLDFGDEEPKEASQDREHYITPLIEKPEAVVKDIILRSNLFFCMTAKKHRLDVLITDSCSSKSPFEGVKRPKLNGANLAMFRTAPAAPEKREKNYAFKYLLTHSQGKINWNSSCPYGLYRLNDKTGKIEFRNSNSDREQSFGLGGDDFGGTVFTRAFVQTASRELSSGNQYTINDFFQDLGKDYEDVYASFREYVRNVEKSGTFYNSVVKRQVRTRLTAFNTEDDHTDDPKKNLEVALKTNNRIKAVYDNVGIGSKKTSDPTVKAGYGE